ncbi:glycosyltransferase family 39 protein [soil metagenome]
MTSKTTLFAVVAALLVASWLLTLGMRHLVPSDEGRYAEIAREMFSSGDWVTIRYNDLKYFEKPPLHLWVTALAYAAFGIGEWQARLCGALSGLLGVAMTMLAMRRWYGNRVALMAGAALIAMPTWNFASHFNSLDITVAGVLACVLMSLLLAQHPDASPTERRNWMWVCWFSMALALLTKGLIGIALPGLAGVVYLVFSQQWSLLRRLHLRSGLIVLLVVAAPWFVLIADRNPEFLQFFFIHEHWTRFTSTEHHRSGPFWYFVPQLIAGALPWIGLVPAMSRAVSTGPAQGFRPLVLFACWTVSIFVFFSVSGSKLPGYIVPIFPAIAGLAAVALDQLGPVAMRRQLLGIIVMAVIGLAVAAGFALIAPSPSFALMAPAVCTSLVVLVAGGCAALRFERRGRLWSVVTISIATYVGVSIALAGYSPIARIRSNVDLAQPVQRVLKPDMPIYAVRLLDHTLPFYLGRTMIPVEMGDELDFGIRQEPDKWIPTVDDFLAKWAHGPQALAVMRPAVFDTLSGQGVAMTVVARSNDRVVVANFK